MFRSLFLVGLVSLLFSVNANAQCDPVLSPLDDGSGANGAVGLPSVVISEINPGDYIELYNTTAGPVNTTGLWFCSPFLYTQVGAIVIPAGGYATATWPVVFPDTDAGGEIQLYKSNLFATSTEILDFVCWGVNPHGTRINQALAVGKWTGGCAPALVNGAIHRKVGTQGKSAADYDVTAAPTPSNCVPGPTGVTPPLPIAKLTNYPNPFSGQTQIDVSLTAAVTVDIAVFSIDGARVRSLGRRALPAGSTSFAWDGTDDNGNRVPSGVYLVRLDGPASAVARVVNLH